MRAILLRTIVVLALGAPMVLASAPAGATTEAVGTAFQRQAIANLLAQYPDGGQALADAIAQAVEADPSLARVTAAAALSAPPAQQQAIGMGLAEAALFFANGNSVRAQEAQQQIQAAIALAPTGALTAFNTSGGTTALLTSLGAGGLSLTTSTCVSPSRPGSRC